MLGLLIYLLVIGILLAGSWRRPAVALGAALSMFALEQWGASKIGLIASHSSLSNYISFMVVMFGLGLQIYRTQRLAVAGGTIQLLVALLFLLSAASLLWTPVPKVGVEEWRAQWPYVLVTVLFLPMLIRGLDDAKVGLRGTLVVGAILTFALTFLVSWGYRSIDSDAGGQAIRLPLAIAQLGAYTFILTIAFMRWRGFYALLAVALLVISVVLVVKTGSRGQLIAMIASGFVVAPIAHGSKAFRAYLPIAVLAIIAGLSIWAFDPKLLASLSGTEADRFDASRAVQDYQGRIDIARALFDAYMRSDVLGLLFGLGTSAAFSRDIVGFYPHIVPIEILCELGIVGFGLFLAILVWTAVAIIRSLRIYQGFDPSRSGLRVIAALTALFICEVLLSFKEGSLLRDSNLFLFPLLIERVAHHAYGLAERSRRAALRIGAPAPMLGGGS